MQNLQYCKYRNNSQHDSTMQCILLFTISQKNNPEIAYILVAL